MMTQLHGLHQLETLFLCYFSLFCVAKIRSVAHEIYKDISVSIVFNLFLPLLTCLKGFLRCNVIYEYDGMRPLIKNSRDGSESLLTSCVPNLELNDVLVVYSHDIVSEFYADGNVMLIVELVVYQPGQNAGFSDA